MVDLLTYIYHILNPSTSGLSLGVILLLAFILGILHGITPDEHTWPITFSYSVGSYSTKGGMKAGFTFSLGFIIQRSVLTTLGFLGLAEIYKTYNLDGPVYIIVGLAMFFAGAQILRGKYIHIPIDRLFGGRTHHSSESERKPLHELEEEFKPVSLKLAIFHGFIAGWGLGAYASIIVFILAPQVGSIFYAPLVGCFFGLGTMAMQIIIGAVFANFMKVKKLTIEEIKYVGKSTAGHSLYYGGLAFAVIGFLVIFFPFISNFAISTGIPIPNLDSLGSALLLTLIVVGGIGLGSMYKAIKVVTNYSKSNSDSTAKNIQ